MIKQVIVVRKDLQMTKGKIAAQVAHASQYFMIATYDGSNTLSVRLTKEEQEWLKGSHAKIVVYVNTEEELRELIRKGKDNGLTVRHVIDAGLTHFDNVPTLTCAAFGPHDEALLNPITGGLKLL